MQAKEDAPFFFCVPARQCVVAGLHCCWTGGTSAVYDSKVSEEQKKGKGKEKKGKREAAVRGGMKEMVPFPPKLGIRNCL